MKRFIDYSQELGMDVPQAWIGIAVMVGGALAIIAVAAGLQ